ncbi:S24/S26 family peptidase [Thermococcus sp. 101 C5]|uniref:S24/S26 family peptidase n=1 Tax=Thermococcus sp. 101 C5 TaxID=2654197 RepID=UPI001561CA4F|nr:S24/S26 family peptidase [Thermococcus sp. 101 C5]
MKIMGRKELEALCVEALKKKGSIKLKVTGNSMYPVIKEGDIVSINRFQPEIQLHPGDIVLIRNFDGVILHRVVKIKGNSIITKGDNNPLIDGVFNISDVLGIADITSDVLQEDLQKTYETRRNILDMFVFLIYSNKTLEPKMFDILEDFHVNYELVSNKNELVTKLVEYEVTVGITNYAPKLFESVIHTILNSDGIPTHSNKQKVAIIIGAKYGYSKHTTDLVPPTRISHFARVSSPFISLSPEQELLFCLGVLYGSALSR